MGLHAPFEAFADLRSRYLVHGSRHVVSTTTRSFADPPADTGVPAASMGFPPPSRSDRMGPAGTFRVPAALMGFCAPTATSAREIFSSRVSSPGPVRLQGFHPPDGLLPPAPPGPWDQCHSWGSPCRAFPLDGAVRLSAPVPSCRFRHRVLLL
jgi:hypothetical protein